MYGRDLTPQEKFNMVNTLIDLASLTDEQRAAVDAAVTGTTPQAPVTPESPPETLIPDFQSTGDPELDETIRAAIQAGLAPVQQQLSQVQQQSLQQARERQELEQQMELKGQEEGLEAFKAAHPDLTENEIYNLSVDVRTNSLYPMYRRTLSPQEAAKAAYEQAYIADPTYRTQMAQEQINAEKAKLQQEEDRKDKAAALSSSGAPASTSPSADPKDQMVAELSSILNR